MKSISVKYACAIAAVMLVAIASHAGAQVPAPGVIAFTGARVIDGTGSAPIEQATIVVTNGRVTAIGPAATVMPPAGATIVNVAGKTIIPGLINSHAHIDPDISANPGPYRDEMVRRLKTYATYGVTSVMTLGFETYDEPEGFYLRDTQRLGIGPVATDAPRLYASGRPILFRPGPNGLETPDDARIDVQRHVPLRADFIKLHLDGVAVDLKPDVIAAAIDEAHKHNMSTAIHIIYLKDAKTAIASGVDVIAHSVRDLDIDAATIAEMKRRNVALVPTLVRDRSVFIYENLPEFFKDPFFLRALPTYRREVDLLSDPASQQRMRITPRPSASKPQLAQGIKNLKPSSTRAFRSRWADRFNPRSQPGTLDRLQRARRARDAGGSGDDADAGTRVGDEHRRARDEDRRRRLAADRQVGRPGRAQRESADGHQEHAADRLRLYWRPESKYGRRGRHQLGIRCQVSGFRGGPGIRLIPRPRLTPDT
jgi:hypothetical protein